jgi:hypothetical protein
VGRTYRPLSRSREWEEAVGVTQTGGSAAAATADAYLRRVDVLLRQNALMRRFLGILPEADSRRFSEVREELGLGPLALMKLVTEAADAELIATTDLADGDLLIQRMP